MSEHAFYLVPSDPFYLPDAARRKAVLAFFQEVSPLPNATGDYYFDVYDEPVLIDAGESFEAVICRACGTRLVVADWVSDAHTLWWEGIRTTARDSRVVMPCCAGEVRLADFRFDQEGAFARFAVGALEPNDSDYWGGRRRFARTGISSPRPSRTSKR